MKFLKVLLPVVIVGFGVVLLAAMVLLSPKARREDAPDPVALVEVVTVQTQSLPALVRATGTVVPDRQVGISAQVGGELVFVADALRPGGRFLKGDVLARVDRRDYELAIEAEKARVESAELELTLEQGRGSVAKREWELLGGGRDPATESLVKREPHQQVAQQALASARAGLARAELNLERTRIVAPFNAVVLQEQAEVGQLVGGGTPLATLAGTDTFRVEITVPVDKLSELEIPGVNSAQGSQAIVTLAQSSLRMSPREGHVMGLSAQLDPATRMARVLVAVEHPMDPPPGELPLLPNAFVEVELRGRSVEDAAVVPRVALVDGGAVWIVDAEDRLELRPVTVAWVGEEHAYVTAGLRQGERVVTTPPSMPIKGMPVRIVGGT